jgi:hypothetical protein
MQDIPDDGFPRMGNMGRRLYFGGNPLPFVYTIKRHLVKNRHDRILRERFDTGDDQY